MSYKLDYECGYAYQDDIRMETLIYGKSKDFFELEIEIARVITEACGFGCCSETVNPMQQAILTSIDLEGVYEAFSKVMDFEEAFGEIRSLVQEKRFVKASETLSFLHLFEVLSEEECEIIFQYLKQHYSGG